MYHRLRELCPRDTIWDIPFLEAERAQEYNDAQSCESVDLLARLELADSLIENDLFRFLDVYVSIFQWIWKMVEFWNVLCFVVFASNIWSSFICYSFSDTRL